MYTVVICGTPGTGKTSLIEKIRPELEEFHFINLSKFAIEHECIEEYDDKLDTQVIDEDKLLDQLESELKEKKLNVIECIHPDMLTNDLISQVFVCRTNNTLLYDRLKERNYNDDKISNNVQAEIFQTILDEARAVCEESMLIELENNQLDDLDKNAKLVVARIRKQMKEQR